MDSSGDGEYSVLYLVESIIFFILAIQCILIITLFVMIFRRSRRRKRRYSMTKTNCHLNDLTHTADRQNADNNSTEFKDTQSSSHNETGATTQLIGINCSMNNPNYMSTTPQCSSSAQQQRDAKTLSAISEHSKFQGPPRQSSKSDMNTVPEAIPVNYTDITHHSANSTVPNDNDTYSLANQSEHNYSCISSQSNEAIVGQLSPDGEDTIEHNYSYIGSDEDRVSTNSSNEENKQPADYEEFYSIAAVDKDTISESDEEMKTAQGGSDNSTDDLIDDVLYGNVGVSHNKESSSYKETVDHRAKAQRGRKRSATSTDIQQVLAYAANKPIPKPRIPRKAVVSGNY